MEVFISCWVLSVYRVLTVTLICMRLVIKEKIRYALARHMLIWNLMVVGALIGTVAVGAVFQWVGNLAGSMVLVAGFFLVWAFKVTCVGHKIFDVRLEEV